MDVQRQVGGTKDVTALGRLAGALARLRGGRDRRLLEARAWALYGAVVARARRPYLFVQLLVPDTTEGRLEMIQLHVGLTALRLGEAGQPGKELAQALFDCMMRDMDRSLRELAVGDLSIGKYVRRMAQSFYFRLQHLDRALATGDSQPAIDILARNVYPAARADQAPALWAALVEEAQALSACPTTALLAGSLDGLEKRA